MQPLVLYLEDPRRQPIDKVPVMRDKQHRPGKVPDRLQQHILGAQIEVVGRLIQQQDSSHGETSIFAIAYRLRSPPESTPSFLKTSSPENMKQPSSDCAAPPPEPSATPRRYRPASPHSGPAPCTGPARRSRSARYGPARIVPLVASSCRLSSRISVDLPAPFAPTSAIRSPRSMVKFRSSEDQLLPAIRHRIDLLQVRNLDHRPPDSPEAAES